MSTDSAPEDISQPLYVSLPAGAVMTVLAAADMDIIASMDDGCDCCGRGGLQYLYWFFMCCENEPE